MLRNHPTQTVMSTSHLNCFTELSIYIC